MLRTQKDHDDYLKNTGKVMCCAKCGQSIEVGDNYEWSGRTVGRAYSHSNCLGINTADRAKNHVKNWESE